MRKSGTNVKWTDKILPLKEIKKEPDFNKKGFWKKPEPPEIEVRREVIKSGRK